MDKRKQLKDYSTDQLELFLKAVKKELDLRRYKKRCLLNLFK